MLIPSKWDLVWFSSDTEWNPHFQDNHRNFPLVDLLFAGLVCQAPGQDTQELQTSETFDF